MVKKILSLTLVMVILITTCATVEAKERIRTRNAYYKVASKVEIELEDDIEDEFEDMDEELKELIESYNIYSHEVETEAYGIWEFQVELKLSDGYTVLCCVILDLAQTNYWSDGIVYYLIRETDGDEYSWIRISEEDLYERYPEME